LSTDLFKAVNFQSHYSYFVFVFMTGAPPFAAPPSNGFNIETPTTR